MGRPGAARPRASLEEALSVGGVMALTSECLRLADVLSLRKVCRWMRVAVDDSGLTRAMVCRSFEEICPAVFPGTLLSCQPSTPDAFHSTLGTGRLSIHYWWRLHSRESVSSCLGEICDLVNEAGTDLGAEAGLAAKLGALFVAFSLTCSVLSPHLMLFTKEDGATPTTLRLILFT
ncbi:hypothetical protein DIPPA_00311 [Diplonema papillatum]|nr:hypothetical protein DIPPA_00311 [Diplonema papillatum]